ATNLLTFTGTLFAAGIFMLLTSMQSQQTIQSGLFSRMLFLIVGLAILPLVVVLIRFTAYDTTRMAVVTLSRLMYNTKIEGLQNIPSGGALLTPNHVSWADGLLVGLSSPRDPRMLVFADYFQSPWLSWFGRLSRVIPIHPGRKSIVESLRIARDALQNGELVCVFPEGGISRTGEMREFKPGVMAILKDSDFPVIPTYIDGMWGSIFSFEGGRFFWKLPKKWRYPVTIRFGEPIYRPNNIEQIQQAVAELGGKKLDAPNVSE
ncbi:MAG: 1-acyl-sn-glycerol-3-phosphate acyltransferase, partial [Thermoguttaceae bacterium]